MLYKHPAKKSPNLLGLWLAQVPSVTLMEFHKIKMAVLQNIV